MKVKNQVSNTIRAKLDLAAIRRSDYRSPLPSCLAEWDTNLYLYSQNYRGIKHSQICTPAPKNAKEGRH